MTVPPIDKDAEMRLKQAATRATLDRGLAKYGWKLGRVFGRGITAIYELVNLADEKRTLEVPIGIEEIAQWTIQDDQNPFGPELAALGISITSARLYGRLSMAAEKAGK